MNFLLYAIAFLFSLGQLGRLSFYGQQVNIYFYEIVAVLYLGLLFIRFRLTPLIKVWQWSKSVFLLIFTLVLSLTLTLSDFKPFENVVAFLYILRLMFYFLFFFYLAYFVTKDRNVKKHLFIASFMVVLLTVLFSVVQYFLYPNLRNLQYLGWDPHQYRLFGLFFDTSVSSAIFGLTLLYILQSRSSILANRYMKMSLVAVYVIFVVLTFSRSLYLSLAIAVLITFLNKKSYLKLIVILAVFILIVYLVPKPFGEGVNLMRTFSISSRLKDYQNAYFLWIKRPILGYGYNHIRPLKLRNNLISPIDYTGTHAGAGFPSFMTILVGAGITGLIAYLWTLKKFAQMNRFAGIAVLFLSLLSLSDNVLLDPFVLLIFVIYTLEQPKINLFDKSR